MNQPIQDKALHDALLAVADGESDAAQRDLVFAALAERPELARFVLEQHRLRAAVAKTMKQPATAPAELRARVEARLQAASDASADSRVSEESPAFKFGPWIPAAVAAMLCVVATLMFISARHIERTARPVGPVASLAQSADDHLLSMDVIEGLSIRHVSCSRLIASLNDSVKFPTEIKDVPKAIGDFLSRSPYDVLDLTALGYEFQGAGRCAIPGSSSVHLIYRAIDRKHRDDALSLWIQPDDGSVIIKPDTMYQPAGEYAVHPIVLWKHGGMLYYLVGDESEAVTKAAQQLSHSL